MRGPKVYNPPGYAPVLAINRQSFTPFWTPDGGIAFQLIAGEDLTRGNVVCILQAGTAGVVYKVPISGNENDMPAGIIYNTVNIGELVTVVFSGVAYVLPEAALTAIHGYQLTTSSSEAGRVTQQATVPAAATHFKECGHFIDDGTGAGVAARAFIHFN